MWKAVAGKLGTLKGYPVRSSFSLSVGGPQCAAPAGSGASPSSAGRPDGSPLAGLAGQLGGLLGGKKKPAAEASSQAAAQEAPGFNRVLTMNSEVVAIRSGPAAPGTFEVPGDFKKSKAE
jgi:hypothetical protein